MSKEMIKISALMAVQNTILQSSNSLSYVCGNLGRRRHFVGVVPSCVKEISTGKTTGCTNILAGAKPTKNGRQRARLA